MAEDIYGFAEMMRRMIERRMKEFFEEMQRSYTEMERLLDERLRLLSSGVIEPLVSIRDEGDRYVIIVDAPGVKGGLDLRFEPRKIIVDGYVDENFVREAMGDMVWARSIRRVHGEYSLPEEIDLESIRVERRGNMVIIVAPKKR